MADIQRRGSAVWSGDLMQGTGKASTPSGALREAPVSFASRFETGTGSNPEELIAAAHASCFSMALAGGLAKGGHAPQEIRTEAAVTLRKDAAGFTITAVHLRTEGRVPGIDAAAFQEAAAAAKDGCPVSKLLKPGLESLTFEATLL